MNILNDKIYTEYNYLCRYTSVPHYFNTVDGRRENGIGSNMKKQTDCFLYKVQKDDTLDRIALEYYNNPSFWWILAYYNNIQDPFIPLQDQCSQLLIPAITGVEFGNERAY